MAFHSKYHAKKPNAQGLIAYTKAENEIWSILFERQLQIVQHRACDTFLKGIDLLGMSAKKIPQCPEMNLAFSTTTGWQVKPVEAIIPAEEFFTLLSQRIFPAATFIRRREELDYLQEPDIFHEFFGHCPMLTDPIYADFMQKYGKIALNASTQDREYLARLYWFTVEFGLIQSTKDLRVYGGGILSSKSETIYCLESSVPKREPLGNGLAALRTPYRIDIMQPIYYVIHAYQDIYDILENDIIGLVHHAQDLGDFKPLYDPKPTDQTNIYC